MEEDRSNALLITVPADWLAAGCAEVIYTHGDDHVLSCIYQGYPAKRALSAMRKHGG